MALGTGIALLPERTFAFALAKFPRRGGDDRGHAAADAVARRRRRSRSTTETRQHPCLSRCTAARAASCSTRSSACAAPAGARTSPSARAACAAEMRAELAGLINEGKTDDEIIQSFIAKYGSQELLARADRQGLQPAGLALPVRGRRLRRRRPARSSSGSGRGARTTSRRRRSARGSCRRRRDMQARLDGELEDLD